MAQDQQEPDLQSGFLRQAAAVLIPKGRLEIDPALTLRHTQRKQLAVRGLDLLDSIFIGEIEVSDLRVTSLVHSTSIRYGLTNRLQLNLTIPYSRVWRKLVLSPEVQRQIGEETETTTSDGGLGDIVAGISAHILREGDYLPDLIMTLSLKSDTGTSPFEVERGSLATGTGFWGLRVGFTTVKVSDPAVLYLSGSYFYHHARDDISGFREVDPPDSINLGFGVSYALNPYLSLTTRFNGGFTEKTEINGLEIDGSELTTASLGLGVTYAFSSKTSLDLSADFGLTEDTPDVVVRVSTPFGMWLPPFFENWKSWRLSRIFRF